MDCHNYPGGCLTAYPGKFVLHPRVAPDFSQVDIFLWAREPVGTHLSVNAALTSIVVGSLYISPGSKSMRVIGRYHGTYKRKPGFCLL